MKRRDNTKTISLMTSVKRKSTKSLSPERKLRFLSKYMEHFIDMYPKSVRPFERWLESMLDRKHNWAKQEIMEKHWMTCWYCKGNYEVDKRLDKTKDHVVPLSKGGLDVKENRVSCCYDCNQWKADKMPDAWLKEINGRIRNNRIPEKYDISKLHVMVNSIKKAMIFAKENNQKVSRYQLQWSLKKY